MSRGPGRVERQITEMFRATGETRGFTVAELCTHVFSDPQPTRVQRVSVLRAAHRVVRRIRAANDRDAALWAEARAAAVAKFGEPKRDYDPARQAFFEQHLALQRRMPVDHDLLRWRATELRDGTLVFHDRHYPVRVWAVRIVPEGVVWADAEIVKITEARVTVRYQGEIAPLSRSRLWFAGAWWRGVRFVSERDGYFARHSEHRWQELYGHLFPDRMPLEAARLLLGLPESFTKEDVIAAFRRAAKRCHPDQGGTAEQFQDLVKARDRLLASIGARATAPKAPTFAPKGMRLVYRVARSGPARIGGGAVKRLA